MNITKQSGYNGKIDDGKDFHGTRSLLRNCSSERRWGSCIPKGHSSSQVRRIQSAAPNSISLYVLVYRGCGTHITAERRTSSERRFQTSRVPPAKEGANATLDVHFHVIFANQTREGGYVSDEVIQKQIDVLNEDYGNSKTGLTFNLANVTRVESEEWFLKVGPES